MMSASTSWTTPGESRNGGEPSTTSFGCMRTPSLCCPRSFATMASPSPTPAPYPPSTYRGGRGNERGRALLPAVRLAGQGGHHQHGQQPGGALAFSGSRGDGVRRPLAGRLEAARDGRQVPPQACLREPLATGERKPAQDGI